MAAQNYAIPHKRNDSLLFAGRVKLPSGTWSATSALKMPESDVIVASLTVSALTPLVNDSEGYTHVFTVSHPASGQADWPIQLVDCDVQYTRAGDGFVKSTPTFKVKIARDQA